ncbi:MAG: hypothetical protein JWQ59_1714 [Cryobacterium sp.]|nr:hypothetical protein [Cryobacterium sp.]
MPKTYPKDRFDDLPRRLDRVGAHRGPPRKGRGWIAFWWALAATIILIASGAVGLLALNERLDFSGGAPTTAPTAAPTEAPTPAPPPTAEPTVDPELDITVLNGTPGIGVAGAVADLLTEAGWSIGATADASTEDVAETSVYYADAALEGAARGVAASLPGSTIVLTDEFADSGADITVVVGNDYEAPSE